jgi:hypothetical protein
MKSALMPLTRPGQFAILRDPVKRFESVLNFPKLSSGSGTFPLYRETLVKTSPH